MQAARKLRKFLMKSQNNINEMLDYNSSSRKENNNEPATQLEKNDKDFASSQSPVENGVRGKKKDKIVRKRSRNVNEWASVKAKKLLNLGMEHENRKGKTIQSKAMGPGCEDSCRLKCHERLSEEKRERLFKSFWDIGDHTRQWDFIGRCVKVVPKKQVKVTANAESRRQISRQYFFISNTGQDTRVCKNMFLQTLGISDKMVTTVCRKMVDGFIAPDKRGRHHNRPNKIATQVKDSVRKHIHSFPLAESGHNKKESPKRYLDGNLSITKMHRLYLEWIKSVQLQNLQKPATLRQYTDIFNAEFNISFLKSKKEPCKGNKKNPQYLSLSPEKKHEPT